MINNIFFFIQKQRSVFLISFISYIIGVTYNRKITFEIHSEGTIYNRQAEELFLNGLINPYPQRILTPLISRTLNINTQHLNLIFIFVFILVLNIYLKSLSNQTKLIFSLAISTTMPIIFSMNFGGYPDIVSYTIFLLIFLSIRKKYLPYIMFFFLLLTREAFLIYYPFLIIYKTLRSKDSIQNSLFGFSVAVIMYMIFYISAFKIAENSPGDIWNYSFYLEPLTKDLLFWIKNYRVNYFIGIFSSIKFLLLLLVIIFFQLDKKQKFLFLIFIFLTLSTSFVCGDLSRCFSPLIFAMILFPEKLEFKYMNLLTAFLFILNVISPKYYVWHGGKLNYLNDSRIHFFDIFKFFN